MQNKSYNDPRLTLPVIYVSLTQIFKPKPRSRFMLKIRLKRYGRKKLSIYRVIVIDSRKRRDGKALEEVGCYNPLRNESKLNIERIQKRISQGAQLSETVKSLVRSTNDLP
jgi:small subunit ribosomal protein S16